MEKILIGLVALAAGLCTVHAQIVEVKNGTCPPVWDDMYMFNSSAGNECYMDSACVDDLKCCPNEDNVYRCTKPEFWATTTTDMTPRSEPTRKPWRDQKGSCPSGLTQYYGYDSHDITCTDHCNGNEDCADGELCCVEQDQYINEEWKRDVSDWRSSRCPVCQTALLGCTDYSGFYHQNGQIYQPDNDYDTCEICQCYDGQSSCYYACKRWGHEWKAAGVVGGVALLLSVIFTLSVCCCLKCCCKDKPQTIQVMQQPPVMQAQQPSSFYYAAPRQQEKAPLTDSEMA